MLWPWLPGSCLSLYSFPAGSWLQLGPHVVFVAFWWSKPEAPRSLPLPLPLFFCHAFQIISKSIFEKQQSVLLQINILWNGWRQFAYPLIPWWIWIVLYFRLLWVTLLWTQKCRFVWSRVFISSGQLFRYGIVGSCSECMFNFIGNDPGIWKVVISFQFLPVICELQLSVNTCSCQSFIS